MPVRKNNKETAPARKAPARKAVAKKAVAGKKAAVAKKKPSAPAKKAVAKKVPAKKASTSAPKKTASPVAKKAKAITKVSPKGAGSTKPKSASAKDSVAVRKSVSKKVPGKAVAPVARTLSPLSPNAAPTELDSSISPGHLTPDDLRDESDIAQWIQLTEQAEIASRSRFLNQPQTHPDFDGRHCIDCGVEIPEARLKNPRIRCVVCQEWEEQESARKARLGVG